MPGTKAGGAKAAKTNKERYDHLFPDEEHGYYGKIGGIGGKISRGGGFSNPELAAAAGRKGGSAPHKRRGRYPVDELEED